ncbi:MAG: hypothetical protein GTO14_07875 [Anaerolineales bacterium]|nr:hypothetical protein [Anaerolineales bacterium]
MPNEIYEATKRAMDNALKFCIEKTDLENRESFMEARLRGDCSVCEYFRYGLAKGVAEFLGTMDKKAKAIYVYDTLEASPTLDNRMPEKLNLSSGVHLIVWTTRKSPALNALVDSITNTVAKELEQISCPHANALCHQIDIAVVDDHEVNNRIGYGSLIHSLYVRPIEIWHREPELTH